MASRVSDTFLVTGRGLVVAIDGKTDLPVARRLRATIELADGRTLSAEASKEWFLIRQPVVRENEAFLLHGLNKDDVPIGSLIDLSLPAD